MKKRLSTTVLMAALLAGCALPPVTGPAPAPGTGSGANQGATRPGDKVPLTDPKTGKPLPNQAVEPLNGVEFKPLTQGNAQYLSNNGGGLVSSGNAKAASGTAAPAAAPSAQAEAAMDAALPGTTASSRASAGGSAGGSGGGRAAGGAFSGNVWSNYGYGYFFGYGFGGNFDQMALVSLQEAETKGSKGTFQEIVAGVVGPIVKAWAGDARLIQSGAVLTNDGTVFVEPNVGGGEGAARDMMVKPGPGYGGLGDGNAWRLVYVSSSRNEILNFTVGAEKTTIIRMRWAPLDLAPERVTVDSASAIKSLIAAIQDRNFRGEEEKSGKDYFLGYPFEQPKTGEWDGEYQKTEVLYEVPKNARWTVNLQQVMGKLVWEVNWYAEWQRPDQPTMARGGSAGTAITPEGEPVAISASAERKLAQVSSGSAMIEPAIGIARPVPAPPDYECPEPEPEPQNDEYYINYYGQGMVDAETGAVIRFTRPTKVTYNYPRATYPCKPMPKPMPAETPTPPKETPKPEPAPSATPTPSTSASNTNQ